MSDAGWNGTMDDRIAATLNLADRMALLNGDFHYCTKMGGLGSNDSNISDKCRTFLNTLDDYLNVMLIGKTKSEATGGG